MKKTIFILIVSLITSVNSALAGNIGVLDVDKIIQESLAVNDIQKKVDSKKSNYESEINKKQTSLEAEQKKLEDKKITLSKEAFDKEVKAFESKVEDLKTFVDRKQNSLKKASIDAMGKVNDKVKSIVAEIAKEKNLDIIVPSSQTLYFKDELDITAEVLASLNKKITKVEVKFE
ncbi:MAG: OmpH family outer membrane protein [Proteobacteria bacterium]|nr:OmpH family outer membrane protein [Pseudomonadota bacterium]NCA28813.1 OmpH family outer membrane protein [Pseudomonadota bacterium]